MSLQTSEVVISNIPLPVDTTGQTINVGNLPATQPVSGTVTVANPGLTDTQLRATPVPVSGSVTISPVVSSSATISQVVLTSGTNVTLLAANANRKKVVLFAPKATLYIKFGAVASATSFTYIAVAANTTFELSTWVGQIDALSTVNQTVTVTEMV